MGKSKGNFDYNYPKLIKYLESNDMPYEEFNGGHHIKIMGATKLVEIWPSRMKYHVIQSEDAEDFDYHQLSFYFNKSEVEDLLK